MFSCFTMRTFSVNAGDLLSTCPTSGPLVCDLSLGKKLPWPRAAKMEVKFYRRRWNSGGIWGMGPHDFSKWLPSLKLTAKAPENGWLEN